VSFIATTWEMEIAPSFATRCWSFHNDMSAFLSLAMPVALGSPTVFRLRVMGRIRSPMIRTRSLSVTPSRSPRSPLGHSADSSDAVHTASASVAPQAASVKMSRGATAGFKADRISFDGHDVTRRSRTVFSNSLSPRTS